jgi:hypothetical protein
VRLVVRACERALEAVHRNDLPPDEVSHVALADCAVLEIGSSPRDSFEEESSAVRMRATVSLEAITYLPNTGGAAVRSSP